jgi:hypothetical protein
VLETGTEVCHNSSSTVQGEGGVVGAGIYVCPRNTLCDAILEEFNLASRQRSECLFKLVHLLVSLFEIEVVFEFYECLVLVSRRQFGGLSFLVGKMDQEPQGVSCSIALTVVLPPALVKFGTESRPP